MILVTGGTGLVGSRILFDLVKRGEEVRAIHRAGSDLEYVRRVFAHYDPERGESLFGKIGWLQGDLLDVQSLEEAADGIKNLYHCAALVSYHPSDAEKLIRVNRDGTANVVNAALEAGVEKMCHLSSVAAIGTPAHGGPANERTSWNRSMSRSQYGLSKYLAEREVWRGAAEGMPCVIVNPSVILGPAAENQSSGALMHLFRKGISYYPPGSAGFVDVRDVAKCAMDLMDGAFKNERYILNAQTVAFRQMLDWAAEIFNHKPPHIALREWMLNLAWPAAAFWALFSGSTPKITRETAKNACSHRYYDTEKVKKAIGIEFIAPKDSLACFRNYF